MTSRDFAYWLQGFFEITDVDPSPNKTGLSPVQVDLIKAHLNMVFKHEIDPGMGGATHQQVLNALHKGKSGTSSFITTEEGAIAMWGPKPSPQHLFNIHGWYHPSEEGLVRC